ncbi:hypothetical protein BDA99DRAFT_345962 [Phascolomyces articulosus]|uniref:Uncharacterized protein n=1 Tax=Phascolomyces articulosus TaxID=60185 RepID=A0AAD5PGA8_9FUNG|nr:hypothetical protein BDA99DRAFT_345962 [Phascolomyces articulosus]
MHNAKEEIRIGFLKIRMVQALPHQFCFVGLKKKKTCQFLLPTLHLVKEQALLTFMIKRTISHPWSVLIVGIMSVIVTVVHRAGILRIRHNPRPRMKSIPLSIIGFPLLLLHLVTPY